MSVRGSRAPMKDFSLDHFRNAFLTFGFTDLLKNIKSTLETVSVRLVLSPQLSYLMIEMSYKKKKMKKNYYNTQL